MKDFIVKTERQIIDDDQNDLFDLFKIVVVFDRDVKLFFSSYSFRRLML